MSTIARGDSRRIVEVTTPSVSAPLKDLDDWFVEGSLDHDHNDVRTAFAHAAVRTERLFNLSQRLIYNRQTTSTNHPERPS